VKHQKAITRNFIRPQTVKNLDMSSLTWNTHRAYHHKLFKLISSWNSWNSLCTDKTCRLTFVGLFLDFIWNTDLDNLSTQKHTTCTTIFFFYVNFILNAIHKRQPLRRLESRCIFRVSRSLLDQNCSRNTSCSRQGMTNDRRHIRLICGFEPLVSVRWNIAYLRVIWTR